MAISESTRALSKIEPAPLVALPALTVEIGLYAALALAALALRFLLLGYAPLGASEAAQALSSWNFIYGGEELQTGSPLLFTANALLFALFGASDWVARLVPAFFGSALVLVPAFLRRELGRTGALVGSLLLALSPSLVFFSRNLDGAVIAVSCALAALVFGWRYATGRVARDLYFAAVAAALALVGGREVWTVVLAVVVLVIVRLPQIKAVLGSTEHGDGAGNSPERLAKPNILPRAAILFLAFFIGLSTALLLHLNGFGAAFNLFGAWLDGLRPVGPLYDPLRLLVVYDPIPLFLGGAAAVELALVRRRLDRDRMPLVALTIWALVAFVLYTLGSDKTPARVVAVVTPLALLAGWFIGQWLETTVAEYSDVPNVREVVLSQEGPVLLFSCVLAVFTYFVLAEFSTRGSVLAADLLLAIFKSSPASGAFNGIVLGLLVTVVIAVVAFLAVTTVGWLRARNVGLLLLLVLFGAWSIRQMALVSFSQVQNPQEWLIGRATSANVRDLVFDLEDLSRWRANDSHTITILADEALGPVARWYLRGFPNALFGAHPTMVPGIQALLTPADVPVNTGSLLSQRYRLESARAGQAPSFLRWLIFRDSGSLEFSDAVLWVPLPQENK